MGKPLLASGGVLVVETPNVESWPMKLFGAYCTQLDAPRHLSLFSKVTITSCIEQAGFDIAELRTFSPSTLEYTESVRYWLRHRGLRAADDKPAFRQDHGDNDGTTQLQREPRLRARLAGVLHVGERATARAVNKLADLFGQGGNLFVVARARQP